MSNPRQQDVYPEDPREDVAPFLPSNARKVLEVGCGRGGFGRTLRSRFELATLVGVEAVPSAAWAARATGCFDDVWEGYFPDAMPIDAGQFDLIIFNDVLEHIVNPWDTLREARQFLAPDGRVVAAIPNIQYAPAVINLARGRWEYTDDGLLDRTHVRFFTRQTMVSLFEDAGYRVQAVHGANNLFDRSQRGPSSLRKVARRLSPLLGNSRFLHFVVVARPDA